MVKITIREKIDGMFMFVNTLFIDKPINEVMEFLFEKYPKGEQGEQQIMTYESRVYTYKNKRIHVDLIKEDRLETLLDKIGE